MSYSALGHLPEMLMLVLRPKGKFRIDGKYAIESDLGMAGLAVKWRTVELWTLSADDFLDAGDVGVMPWVPLMQYTGKPENVLERCATRIEREAPAKQRTDMQVVSQIMTQLRFADSALFDLFKGAQAMIESPLVQKWKAESLHEAVIEVLDERFGAVPRDVTRPVREILNEKKLHKLIRIATICADLDAFRKALPS